MTDSNISSVSISSKKIKKENNFLTNCKMYGLPYKLKF